jgi:hypothetical protein
MRLVIALAAVGVMLALASPWIEAAIVIARLGDADALAPLVEAPAPTQTARARPEAGGAGLSESSLYLRPRHLR